MMEKVLIYSPISEEGTIKLEDRFTVVTAVPGSEEFNREIVTATGLIGSSLKVNEALLERAPLLKVVSNISVGYDNLDIEELTKRGILATNTPDVLTETTADTIFGLLLATARRIPELDKYVKEGNWTGKLSPTLFGVDVHGKTLGIIGMGKIGQAIAKRGRFGFGMDILYHNRSRKPEAETKLGAKYVEMDDLLQQADFVCLMAPQTADTIHLISAREFSLMKETAIFVNGSRGALVNEDDLAAALKEGEILAAGLDVYEHEPLAEDHPFLGIPNLVTLPHIGSATSETRAKMEELACRNLVAGLTGEIPPSLINESVVGLRVR
ncbi:D-glycerate dehydrogenase [Sporosarcina thermotolerans]|uniref:D-glycerate dehydrogenase n=2 Tax=Sporosarcina thermotolerans TaxID=633404 RepID=A0AAW9A4C9_9BACL|nr:D-glycerate dehydrogenase [Sporosarcina thermotolerans]MDW0116116.1 D-glycerate dehydrogenase [Sporosarcina thermotolerans]